MTEDANPHASTQAHGGAELHADPTALAMNATAWVSLAMLLFIAVLIWKKVPALIAGALDKRIEAIRSQLDEAARLRREAEALKAEYEGKMAAAAKDAEAIRSRAQMEAAELLEDAKAGVQALIVRRQKMAEDKIAAAQRAAVAEIRARAVSAATQGAAALIGQAHGAKADKGLVDQAIAELATH